VTEEGTLLDRAEKKAYRLLSLRSHSEKELRVKLLKGGFPAPVADDLIGRLREKGYLDDRAFARQRARDLAMNRLAGDRRISLDLRGRGISEALCREAIREVRGEIGEEEAVDRLIRKKAKGAAVAGMDDRRKARLARSLAGKGFPAGLIFRALKRSEEEGVDDEDGE
jgi:regulatory protein